MCGILAGFGEYSLPQWQAGLAALAHRGPDEHHETWDGRHYLGHHRFTIVGGQKGAQPIWNEDHTVAIVVNGEFYDYLPIRQKLQASGHVFSTQTDSEVLLHLYEEIGVQCLQQLQGEFSFVLWDKRRQLWFAARDPFGVRPLRYMHNARYTLFASEAKAFGAMGIPLQICSETLAFSQAFQYLPQGSTWYQQVQDVLPGSYVLIQNQQLTQTSYKNRQETRHPFQGVDLERAVQRRIPAEVPFCSHLSGGLDSTLITLLARNFGLSQCFTVDFPNSNYSEVALAQKTTQQLGLDLDVLSLTQEQLLLALPAAVWHAESIGINGHFSAKYLLSKYIAKAGFRVALTGEGADELFYGYAHFQRDRDAKYQIKNPLVSNIHVSTEMAVLPGVTHSLGFVPAWLNTKAIASQTLARFRSVELQRQISQIHQTFAPQASGNALEKSADLWIQYCLSGYILQTLDDGVGMAGPVESRLPFLDAQVVLGARNTPLADHFAEGLEKAVLRHSFQNQIPPHIFSRVKQPFLSPPLPQVLQHAWAYDLARHQLTQEKFLALGFCADPIIVWLDQLQQRARLNQIVPADESPFVQLLTLSYLC